MLDEPGAEGAHGGVLLGAVAMRDDDGDRYFEPAPGISERLAVIAAGGRDQPVRRRMFARQPADIDQAATHLEGADRRVVLVFYPDLRARPLAQQWPAILRRRRKGVLHLAMRRL